MKKIVFTLLFLLTSLYASLSNEYPSQALLNKHIPIVDIRTQGEWRETGILKGAIPITFFKADGSYNVREFLQKLHEKVDTKKPFALICRTAHRSTIVSNFLANKLGYDVINLKGGMNYAISKHLPLEHYPK